MTGTHCDSPKKPMAVLILAALCLGWTVASPNSVFAQAATSAAAEEVPAPAAESVSLPHGKFLLDYLLVAALIAGAVYAVCRSSRRL